MGGAERSPVRAGDRRGDGLATALTQAKHGLLPDGTTSGVELLVGVLVALLATDERLVHLDDPTERASITAARFAKATQHEPRRLLRDANLFGKLK